MDNSFLESILADADRVAATDLYPARCRTVISNLATALRSQSSDLVECREYAQGLEQELADRAAQTDRLLAMAHSMHEDFQAAVLVSDVSQ